jgi:hypothetical protein
MRNIFVEGIKAESIKDDEKMAQLFDEFDAKVFQIAEKKFKTICKKFGEKATLSMVIKFEEEKR